MSDGETTTPERTSRRRRPVRVLGHRGASAVEVENTLAAFDRAGQLGADGVELDVRLLADGALAVHHDATLPDGRRLATLGAADLPPHVPQLAEVLTICGTRSLRPALEVNVEIKHEAPAAEGDRSVEAIAAAVVDTVHRARRGGFDGKVSVSSFAADAIGAVRALDPALPTGWLTAAPVVDWAAVLDGLVAAGHRALHPHDRLVDAALVAAAHARGLEVAVWTVNDPGRLAELVGLGVDAVISDVPDVAVDVVDRGHPGVVST